MLNEMIILALLDDKDRYGYEIKKIMELIFSDRDFLNNNQLYPILHRFTCEGLAEKGDPGRSGRVLYKITNKGRERFTTLLENYGPTEALDENEFFIRVSMFDKLKNEVRDWVLELRRKSSKKSFNTGEDPSPGTTFLAGKTGTGKWK